MERKDELEARVRETPLSERLSDCRKRIGKMCSEGRPPRMCIPVQWDDDDFYISTTLADAQRALDAEREKVKELECYRALWKRRDDELTGVLAQLAILQAQVQAKDAEIAALKEHQKLHDRILERQKLLLSHYAGTIKEAAKRLRYSTHSIEQPEPYNSRTPIVAAFLEQALGVNAEELEKERDTLTHTNARLMEALEVACCIRVPDDVLEAYEKWGLLVDNGLTQPFNEWFAQQALADTDMKNQDLIRIACTWQFDDDDTDMAETECGHAFTFEDPDRAADWMKFCCYCGKPVELLRPEDIDEVNK